MMIFELKYDKILRSAQSSGPPRRSSTETALTPPHLDKRCSEMQPIIPDRPSGTPPLPASAPRERRAPSGGRLARLAALDPGQPRQALIFLSGYRPRVFDVILDAVEPPDLSRTRRPSSRMPVG